MQIKISLFFCFVMLFVSCKSLIYYPNAVLGEHRYSNQIEFFKNKTCRIAYAQKRNPDDESFFAVEATYKIEKKHKKHWIISFYATQAEKDYLELLKNTDSIEYSYRKNLLPDNLKADYFPYLQFNPNYIKYAYVSSVATISDKGFMSITDKNFIANIRYYDCVEVDAFCSVPNLCNEFLYFYVEVPNPKNSKRNLFHGIQLTDLVRRDIIEHFDIRSCSDKGGRSYER